MKNTLRFSSDHWRQSELLGSQKKTYSNLTTNISLIDLIKEKSREFSEKDSIICDGKHYTYLTMWKRVNEIAAILLSNNIGAGSIVAVSMHRSENLVFSLLAILDVGATFLPLDPAWPSKRIVQCLNVVGGGYLLSSANKSASVCLARVGDIWLNYIDSENNIVIANKDFCRISYVIFTSGSSGEPKAVLVSESSLLNLLASIKALLNFDNNENMLFLTSLSFDISLLEIFLPLISGAQLSIYTANYLEDIGALRDYIAIQKITVVQATPSVWSLIVSGDLHFNKTIKLLSGGEYLSQALANKLLRISKYIWNLYGPTETTIWSTAYQIKNQSSKVYLGKPLLNTHLFVLNEDLEPSILGNVGELYIGGAGVSKGYAINHNDVKQRFFSVNSSPDSMPLYATGDLVKYDNLGNLIFIGRADRQVKKLGQRIELQEIENTLLAHALVTSCSVVLLQRATETSLIIAFVCLRKTRGFDLYDFQEDTQNELNQHLALHLPVIMLPNAYYFVDSLPLTSNGKMDYKYLENLVDFDNTIIEPFKGFSDTEKKLANLWGDLLKVKIENKNDNFYENGGNSLLTAILSSKIMHLFNRRVGIKDLIDNPTIFSMSQMLQKLNPCCSDKQ